MTSCRRGSRSYCSGLSTLWRGMATPRFSEEPAEGPAGVQQTVWDDSALEDDDKPHFRSGK